MFTKHVRRIVCGAVVVTTAFALTTGSSLARRAAAAPAYRSSGPALPRPANQATPVLLYRAAVNASHTQQGVAVWVFGDGGGGSIRLRAMASGGHASDAPGTPGAGRDLEPTWPAWISPAVPITWTGWKRVDFPAASLQYRKPAGADATTPDASFSSADAVGIDTTRRSGNLYISSLEWDGADGTPASAMSIDVFRPTSTAVWRVHGTPEAVKSVAWKAGVTPPVPHAGRTAMKLSFVNAAAAEALSTQYLKEVVGFSNQKCVVFVPSSPFDRQLPDALPGINDSKLTIDTFACADQQQSASFTLYSAKTLSNVTVTQKTPLGTVGHNLPASAVDIDVVKVVKQHGGGTYVDWDATGATPSMLVKDDNESFATTDGSLPTVRLTGDPRTDIPAYTQKQFWITIDVPKNAPAGNYIQQLEISADQLRPFSITLDVTVMPLRLMSPSKQYAIDFKGKLARNPVQYAADTDPGAIMADNSQYLRKDQFQAELADISKHGFRYATLTDQGSSLWDAVDAYMSVPGLGYPFLYTGFSSVRDAKAVDSERSRRRMDPFYFLDSSPNGLSQDAAQLKAAGIQAAMIVPDDNSLPAGIDSLTLAIHQADDPYVKRLVAGGERVSNQRDWLAWRSADSNPLINRLYTGFVLFRSNMYGAYAMDYQSPEGGNPFDDAAPRAPGHAGERPQMLTYPVNGGLIDTVQWEAAREGVTDVRYLTTFFAALRECKDNKVDVALLPTYESNVKSLVAKLSWGSSDAQVQAARLTVARYAMKLRTDVDHYYAVHGGG